MVILRLWWSCSKAFWFASEKCQSWRFLRTLPSLMPPLQPPSTVTALCSSRPRSRPTRMRSAFASGRPAPTACCSSPPASPTTCYWSSSPAACRWVHLWPLHMSTCVPAYVRVRKHAQDKRSLCFGACTANGKPLRALILADSLAVSMCVFIFPLFVLLTAF